MGNSVPGNKSGAYKLNKPLTGLLVYRRIMPSAERLHSKFHSCSRSFVSQPTVHFWYNLSALGSFVVTHPLISARFHWLLYVTWCKSLDRHTPRNISTDIKRRLDRATYCLRSHRRHIGRTQFVINKRNIKSKACGMHTTK